MTTQELVERLNNWIEGEAAIDWPYPTLPADRAEVLRAAASRLSEMDAKNKRLREALADLTSWFTLPMISGKVWIIPAGERGADDAVNAARAALEHQQKGEGL